jgi:RsiW-degrading membrane proteinase PrsW (M82 family)
MVLILAHPVIAAVILGFNRRRDATVAVLIVGAVPYALGWLAYISEPADPYGGEWAGLAALFAWGVASLVTVPLIIAIVIGSLWPGPESRVVEAATL